MLPLWLYVYVGTTNDKKKYGCVCILFSCTPGCMCTCDSAVETGEGGVEKFLAGVVLLLPQALRTEGGGGEVKWHNEVPVALCVGNTAGVQPGSLSYGDVLIMFSCT